MRAFLKNFAKFTGKYLRRSLFFKESTLFKKEILTHVFSCEFCKICKNIFFIEHLRWLLLSSEKTNWHIPFKENDGVMYNTLGLRGNHTHKHKYFQSNLPFWKSPYYSKNISFLYIRIFLNSPSNEFKRDTWERSPLFWFNQSISRWIFFFQKQPPKVFSKKGVLRNFEKFTGKHLRQCLFFNKVTRLMPSTLLKTRLWHRCFPVNFVKCSRTPFLIEHIWWLLLFFLFVF